MTTVETAILKLDPMLKDLPFTFAFLGGSVLSLLVTDPAADAIRVTKDVDVLMGIRTRREYHRLDRMLEQIGFKHDLREDAPICRWIYEDLTIDVLPIREEVLGWNSKWFERALDEARTIKCNGRPVRIISAPYFVALKLEAFEDRGKRDFFMSTDFEDVICLFNGRAGIVEEIAACETLRSGLAVKFAEYLACRDLEDAVEGFVQTEDNPSLRKDTILSRFRRVAALT